MIMPYMHWSQLELKAEPSMLNCKVELETELNGPEPNADHEPEELALEAKAGTAAIYTRLRWAPSEAQGLRPLRNCPS